MNIADLAARDQSATQALVGTACTVQGPHGDRSFAATLVWTQPDVQVDGTSRGKEQSESAQVFGSLSTFLTGFATIEGAARPPLRLDRIQVSDGALAGEWTVDHAAIDPAGGCTLRVCRFRRLDAKGAA